MTIKEFRESHPDSIGNLCWNCKRGCVSVAGAHTCERFDEYIPDTRGKKHNSVSLSSTELDPIDDGLNEAHIYLNKLAKKYR